MRRLVRNGPIGAVAASLAAALVLSGCIAFPEPVAGVPQDGSWVALPLTRWIDDERGRPEAVAFCATCPHRVAVGVLDLSPDEARGARSVLDDPALLVRQMAAGRDARPVKKPPPRSTVAVEPLREGTWRGFSVELARADRKGHPVYGAVLGRTAGERLRAVVAIGDDAAAVTSTARTVAAQQPGS